MKNRLSERERRFVDYFVGEAAGNGTKAARLAGYSSRTARVQASQLLTKLNIRTAISERADRAEREALAKAWERDVILSQIIRNEDLPTAERIRAIAEMNTCEGRYLVRHQEVVGRLTLVEALGLSRVEE